MKKKKKAMKAYILSRENGTVQIGNTVFCVPTQKKFSAPRKGLKGLPVVEVPDKSWASAKLAQDLDRKGEWV